MGYIYLRKNLSNGKCYVGQTKDIKIRNRKWKNLNNRYGGHVINNARKKYGADGFSFELLKECPNDDMNYWEMYYIKEYNSKTPNGYNSTDGGDSAYERTDETRKKMSAAHRGKKRPDISAALKGKKRSEETKAKVADARRGKHYPKISAALKGRKHSPEHIAKVAAAHRGKPNPKISAAKRGKPNPKLAAAKRGKKLSEETKAKIAAAHRGMKQSPEFIEKRVAKLRGRKRPAEVVAKIAAANNKPIQGLDKITGEVVYEFSSINEAQRHGFNAGHISKCCRGERKSHGGYIWRYAEK